MNLFTKSVLTAVHGADSVCVLGVLQNLCWQATVPLVGSDGQKVALTDQHHHIESPCWYFVPVKPYCV